MIRKRYYEDRENEHMCEGFFPLYFYSYMVLAYSQGQKN